MRTDKGDLRGAIEDFTKEIKLAPKCAVAWYNRGSAFARASKFEEGIRDYTEAERLGLKPASLFRNRANLLRKTGNETKALADLERAIGADPNDALSHATLGELLAASGDKRIRNTKCAVDHATRACELTQWKAPQFLSVLAAVYAESGDFKKAVVWQEKAIDLLPEGERAGAREKLDQYRSGKTGGAEELKVPSSKSR